jgi:hypothetical protein
VPHDGQTDGGTYGCGGLRGVACVGHRADHLRDHLARALDLHAVADPQVLVGDEREVVQRRQLHRRAADLHRLQHGERVDRAGAADVHLDVEQRRLGDVGRELARHRPTRLASHVAQLGLQPQGSTFTTPPSIAKSSAARSRCSISWAQACTSSIVAQRRRCGATGIPHGLERGQQLALRGGTGGRGAVGARRRVAEEAQGGGTP